MSYATKQLAENKLIILYLVDKMGIPLSQGEICQFMLDKEYADYFTIQGYISELVETNYLEKTKENNTTRYVITDDGIEVLSFFIKYISPSNKQAINAFVHENSKRIQMEYEVNANYFFDNDIDEFSVKCGVYENDGSPMMEINVIVPSQTQAKAIVHNWKKNVKTLYKSILTSLVEDVKDENNEQ